MFMWACVHVMTQMTHIFVDRGVINIACEFQCVDNCRVSNHKLEKKSIDFLTQRKIHDFVGSQTWNDSNTQHKFDPFGWMSLRNRNKST